MSNAPQVPLLEVKDRYFKPKEVEGIDPRTAHSLAKLNARADAGDPVAQLTVGWCYLTGTGYPQNDKLAAAWVLKAAAAGVPAAQCLYGNLCANGRGTETDPVQALHWFQKAAAKKFPFAIYEIGRAYGHGEGVEQDDAVANEYYQKAADLGCPQAKNNLAVSFFRGRAVVQDIEKARKLFKEAIAANVPEAKLGFCVLSLLYPAQDPAEDAVAGSPASFMGFVASKGWVCCAICPWQQITSSER